MVEIRKEGILLQKTLHGFENEAVLNPATIQVENTIHLFYRAVSTGNYSSIGHCTLSDPLTILERMDVPALFSQCDYESHGVEDPRIVKIDELFYLTYAAYRRRKCVRCIIGFKRLITLGKTGNYCSSNHL